MTMAHDVLPGAAGGDRLYAVELLRTPAAHRHIVRWLLAVCGVLSLALFLPWQQNVQGTGTVSAFSPADRPQTANAVIGGRIEQWHVVEGQAVRKGDPLLRLSEVKDAYLDTNTVDRYRDQLAATRGSIAAKEEKVAALTAQIAALEEGLRLSLEKARNTVTQYEAAVAAAVTDSSIAAVQLARQEALFRDGLKAQADVEAARLRAQRADAALVEQRNELLNARIELSSLQADYADKLSKARADRAATEAEVAEGRAEVAKLRNDVANLDIRSGFYVVRAPQDGIVVRALNAGVGEIVKEGDAVVTVAPADPGVAVQLFVRPMDVPLLAPGKKVRLQFDGWPALQFSGWPSVSVGTFGGEIKVVDQVDAGDGTYRVLVVPDSTDEPWPEQLRMGSGVYGWAMLETVPLWFEVWRQLNGFPPTVPKPEGKAGPNGATKAMAR
jgi:multidrug efflux pump subunit AcrA (membrane-fusion protein)